MSFQGGREKSVSLFRALQTCLTWIHGGTGRRSENQDPQSGHEIGGRAELL